MQMQLVHLVLLTVLALYSERTVASSRLGALPSHSLLLLRCIPSPLAFDPTSLGSNVPQAAPVTMNGGQDPLAWLWVPWRCRGR